MSDQKYVAVAGQYASEDEAIAEFEGLVAAFKDAKGRTFDAAVINRGLDGKLSVAKREDTANHRTRKGLGIGLASGLAVALFPAVALGGALVAGGASGAGIGAIAGHISRKTPSKNLEAISETLDAGSAGIVVVVDPADVAEVERQLANATRITSKDLSVDDDELSDEVDEAYE